MLDLLEGKMGFVVVEKIFLFFNQSLSEYILSCQFHKIGFNKKENPISPYGTVTHIEGGGVIQSSQFQAGPLH